MPLSYPVCTLPWHDSLAICAENDLLSCVLLQNLPIFCNPQEMCKQNKPHSLEHSQENVFWTWFRFRGKYRRPSTVMITFMLIVEKSRQRLGSCSRTCTWTQVLWPWSTVKMYTESPLHCWCGCRETATEVAASYKNLSSFNMPLECSFLKVFPIKKTLVHLHPYTP